jgi:general secretion pathway protein D
MPPRRWAFLVKFRMQSRSPMKLRAFLLLGSASLALFGCHGSPVRETRTEAPLPIADAGAAGARTSGAVVPAPASPSTMAASWGSPQQPAGPAPGVSTSGEAADITLNFVDSDIREIVQAVLGKTLGVPYTIDPTVRGQVSITTPKPVTRQQVIPILQDLLTQTNAVLVIDRGLYQILPTSSAATRPVLGDIGQDAGGGQIVPLHYVSAKELVKLLDPFIAHGGRVVPDPSRNAVVIAGDPLTRRTLTDLIASFDVDILAGQSFALLPVTSGAPSKVATDLQKALLSETDGPLAGQIRVIPMGRINAILVAAAQPRYIEEARRVLSLVDRESVSSEPSWHVYYVQNGQSSDLEYVLQRAFTPNHITATGVSDTNRLGASTPGFGGSNGSQTGTGTTGQTGTTGGLGSTPGQSDTTSTGGNTPETTAVTQQANAGADVPPSLQPLSATNGEAADDTDNGIVIIANRQNNALLVRATERQFGVIEGMLKKIDIVPLQVQIDATIAEVTLNNQLQYGTQFFFKNGGLATQLVNPFTDALSGAFTLTKSVNITLSAIQAVTKLKVLSSPQITVLDNELASIQVGDTVPYLSQTSQSTVTTSAPIVSSISYQQTGVILQVIPRVNSGGLVTLDISQEVSDPVKTTISGIDSPTFQDRKVRSRVVVRDGQTIGLGGMIRDNNSQSNSGIPFLKDIPLLGALFANQDNSRNRTELLVMITPHVIDDQRSARMLTDDLRDQLHEADEVPGELQSMPVGSADPNARVYGAPPP